MSDKGSASPGGGTASSGGAASVVPAPLPARGSFGLIVDRQFGALFWGKLLSGFGVWIHSIVAAIVVYAATRSALWVGLVSVAQFIPQLFLSPLSGKWADTGNLARQLVLGRLLTTVGSAFVAAWCWIAGDPQGYAGAAAVLIGSFVVGLGFVVGGPAQQSIIPLLIRPGELGRAMGLNSLPMTLSRVVGPAIGALMAARLGAAHAFTLAAITHAVFAVMLVLAALPRGVDHDDEDADFSVRSALRHVRGDRALLLLLLVVTAAGFASEPSMTLVPTFADTLGGGTQLVGQLTGAFGLGAAVGYPVYVRIGRHLSQPRTTQLGLVLMATGTAALALAGTPTVALGLFAVVGSGFMITLTAATTLIQKRVPPQLRGRVMALWFMGFIGSRPLAAALDGWLADAYSLAAAVLVTAGLLVVLLALFRPARLDFSAAAQRGLSD